MTMRSGDVTFVLKLKTGFSTLGIIVYNYTCMLYIYIYMFSAIDLKNGFCLLSILFEILTTTIIKFRQI